MSVIYFLVTDNFFETMETRMVRGRNFDATDSRSTPWVAVINETMAKRFWPDQDPIGKRFTVDAALGESPREVIGVVRDVALQYIQTRPARPVAYTLYDQQPERYRGFNTGMFGQMTFFVRSSEDPMSLASAARLAVAEVDPDHPIANIKTMAESVGSSMRPRRYYVSAFSIFALMATVLAAVGVYGVMSSSVAQRTREIGIRMSLGATSADIFGVVSARAFRLIFVGLLLGFLGFLLLSRWRDGLLLGVTSSDPMTLAAATAFLIAVSAVACFVPARRATRLHPTEPLRTE